MVPRLRTLGMVRGVYYHCKWLEKNGGQRLKASPLHSKQGIKNYKYENMDSDLGGKLIFSYLSLIKRNVF
jgi:hypothetical protein